MRYLRKAIELILLIMMWLPRAAGVSAPPFDLWLSPDGTKTAEAVAWEKGKDGCYLYLPGNTDLGDLQIGFDRDDEIRLNDEVLHSGDSAGRLQAENTICYNRKEITLHVLRGSTGLPALYITTESGSLETIQRSKKNKEAGFMVLRDGEGKTVCERKLSYIKLRGNATAIYPKKNYQIKMEEGASLLGMGKAKRWVLRGGYIDRSMLREEISFDVAEYAGMEYTPEHRQCELYVNNEYLGLYLLMERIEPDDDRLDIRDLEEATEALNAEKPETYKRGGSAEPEPGEYKYYQIPNDPEEITGGYILEYEATKNSQYREEASAYHTKRGSNIIVKSPEYASEKQMEYITGKIQSMENAIFAEDGIDPGTGKHFTEIIDLDSFARKYILAELMKEYDANKSSEYMYKPEDAKSEKIFAGPVWDYDNCLATYARERNQKNIMSPEGLFVGNASGVSLYWPALYRQEVFRNRVSELYGLLFRPAVNILLGRAKDPAGKLLSLDEYAARIADSAEMNYTKYPELRTNLFFAKSGSNLEENVDYIRNYLSKRADFLDEEWIPWLAVDD